MSFLGKTTTPAQETVEAGRERLEHEARAELRNLDSQLKALNDSAKEFGKRHFVLVGNQLTLKCEAAGDRCKLDAEWQSLSNQTSRLIARRNVVLRTLASFRFPFLEDSHG